jgi:DNA end-binding protein Ku
MHTMRFADELADPGDFELEHGGRKPEKRELEMASALVDGLYTKFDATEYEDAYRHAVEDVIRRKAEGKEIEPPAEDEEEPPDDLMAALEASLRGRKKART